MIEPTETESKETLDAFCDAMIQIAKETEENPAIVQEAPHTTVVYSSRRNTCCTSSNFEVR